MPFRSLPELLEWQARRLGPRTALRFRRHGIWHDISWSRYYADALACAAALIDAGMQVGDRVGLLSENRAEWLIADMGILAAGAVNVPPHAPLTAAQVEYQLRDSGCRWLFVSGTVQLGKVLSVRHSLAELRGIVSFDSAGPDACPWKAFLQRGRQILSARALELDQRRHALGPDDLATIMYTSGTTGEPKGVMLTHGNLLSNAEACRQAAPREEGSVLLSWLPYSHIYARTIDHYLSLAAGVTVCPSPSPEQVVDDLAEIRPTHLTAVPRFYEKVLSAVGTGDDGRRLRELFGPRTRWLISGGAPLPAAIARAYEAAGVLLLQGYGLTESSPVITCNRPTGYKHGTVGRALPGVEVRIAPDGEVLTRGPHVMRGYWNAAEATAEAVRDGWLHTGDLGELDADGFLTITGRKKELIVLSNGKKVAPALVEGRLASCEYVEQAVVFGDGRPFLSAVVVPRWGALRRKLDKADVEPAALASEAHVHDFLRRQIDAALASLAPWERVKALVVRPEPFSVESGEQTVSLKVRRGAVYERHAAALEALYRTRGRGPD